MGHRNFISLTKKKQQQKKTKTKTKETKPPKPNNIGKQNENSFLQTHQGLSEANSDFPVFALRFLKCQPTIFLVSFYGTSSPWLFLKPDGDCLLPNTTYNWM